MSEEEQSISQVPRLPFSCEDPYQPYPYPLKRIRTTCHHLPLYKKSKDYTSLEVFGTSQKSGSQISSSDRSELTVLGSTRLQSQAIDSRGHNGARRPMPRHHQSVTRTPSSTTRSNHRSIGASPDPPGWGSHGHSKQAPTSPTPMWDVQL